MSKDFKAYLKNFLNSDDPNGNDLAKWQPWTSTNQILSIDATQDKAIIESKTNTATAEEILSKMESDTSLTEETKEELNTTVLNGRWFSSIIDNKYAVKE